MLFSSSEKSGNEIVRDYDYFCRDSIVDQNNKYLKFIKVKEEKDPLPFGEVEICPFEYINGWALDNNGIEGGWLFSEDA